MRQHLSTHSFGRAHEAELLWAWSHETAEDSPSCRFLLVHVVLVLFLKNDKRGPGTYGDKTNHQAHRLVVSYSG